MYRPDGSLTGRWVGAFRAMCGRFALRTEAHKVVRLSPFNSRFLLLSAIERDRLPNLADEWMRSVFNLEDRQ
jgi:hypothetical protein